MAKSSRSSAQDATRDVDLLVKRLLIYAYDHLLPVENRVELANEYVVQAFETFLDSGGSLEDRNAFRSLATIIHDLSRVEARSVK